MNTTTTDSASEKRHTVGLNSLLVDGEEALFRAFISETFAAIDVLRATRRQISRGIGLTTSQFAVLIAIAQLNDGAPSIKRIAGHLRISASNVTADVGRLVERGLLLKRVSSGDVRALEIYFTVKGKDLLRKLLPIARRTNDTLFAQMSADEMKTITRVFSRVTSAGPLALETIAGWKETQTVEVSTRTSMRRGTIARPARK